MADLDAVVIGAGFAGIYAVKALRDAGLSVAALEAGSGIGGTWYWNCYPGARCDVESKDYSYSFSGELQNEWSWSERYPAQPEVLRYLHHVADRFGLWRDIRLNATVTSASWDDDRAQWTVVTQEGAVRTARFLVGAVGCLSACNIPDIPGLGSFAGQCYHTARWPKEGADFTGKRVAVIGTGSTGIQVAPEIAAVAEHLYVFQRTAHFAVPNRNAPVSPEADAALKDRYPQYRAQARESFLGVPLTGTGKSALEVTAAERAAAYQEKWNAGGGMPFLGLYTDLLVTREANDTVAEFIRERIRETVTDPALALVLCPRDYPVGAKRLAQSDDYYAMFNRPNVTLVNVRTSPVVAVATGGLQTTDEFYELDAIVFATGFDAISGALDRITVTGSSGLSLKSAWAAGPRAYLGLMTAGFPNFFIVTGPGSPSVFSNMVLSIEQHVEWIRDCVGYVLDRGAAWIEALAPAQDAWVAHTHEVAHSTLFPLADSWYVGANIPGKARVFSPYVGGVGPYRRKCDEVVANGYEGFALSYNGTRYLTGVGRW
jgi:cation diffusion facilitator CzcD-associated flavoprotein CzcO